MYDNEYEWDILLFLRILKYLHTSDTDMVNAIIRDYYIISNYDQSKVAWQLGLNTYVIGGQISENEAKEIIDSIT